MEGAYLGCKRLEVKIKAQNEVLKDLREKYKTQKLVLYESMKAKKKNEYKGYLLEDLAPKPKSNLKEVKAQKEASIRNVLAFNGVHNPEEVLTKIQDIQRPKKKKGDGK